MSVTTAWPQIRPGGWAPARQPAGLAMTAPHPGSVPAAERQVVELAAGPAGPNTVGVPGALPEPPRTSGQGGGEDPVSAPGGSALSQRWLWLPTDSLADMVVASSSPRPPSPSHTPSPSARAASLSSPHHPTLHRQPVSPAPDTMLGLLSRNTSWWWEVSLEEPVGSASPTPTSQTRAPGGGPCCPVSSSLKVPRHTGRVL